MATKKKSKSDSVNKKPTAKKKPIAKKKPTAKKRRAINPDALRLDDLQPDPINPREIDSRSSKGLQSSIKRFGDISGIVLNKRSGYLVSGHQRIDNLKKLFGDEIKMESNEIVCPNGWRFPIRVVDWDEKTARAAMVAANSEAIAGTFTTDIDLLLSDLQEVDPESFEELNLDELLIVEPYEIDEPIEDNFGEVVTETPGGKKVTKKLWVYFEADTREQYDWLLERFAASDDSGKTSQRLLSFSKMKKLMMQEAPLKIRNAKPSGDESTRAVKRKFK